MNSIIKTIKFKLNMTIIFTILLVSLFIYYKGDLYLDNILQSNKKSIVAININNPFKEDESSKVVLLSNNTTTNTNILSNWSWPTTSNYTITTYYSYYHNALDIYSYDGYDSDIYSANNGEVIEINSNCISGNLYCNGKRGNYIIIKHPNNYYTIYMHLNKIIVNKGDLVSSGTKIATMGNTGNVLPIPNYYNPYNGTHLHFNVYIGEPYKSGYTINPLNLYK